MNLESLKEKLLTAARTNAPSDQVPYSFEKRIMAHLAARPKLDLAAIWARGLWRAAGACVILAVVITAWSFVAKEQIATSSTAPAPATATYDFAQHFEKTMLAAVDETPSEETW